MRIFNFCLSFLFLAYSNAAFSQSMTKELEMPTDWSKVTIDDAQAIHDIFLDSHPGTFDKLNPDFKIYLEDGLKLAKSRAKNVDDKYGWWWALRAYVNGFNDGHVSIGSKFTILENQNWAGFLTKLKDNKAIVAYVSADDKNIPPIGAVLQSCDGIASSKLIKSRLADFRGRWQLLSQRENFGDLLFVDLHNPFISNPKSCIFKTSKGMQKYDLNWQVLDNKKLSQLRDSLNPRPNYTVSISDKSGIKWVSLSGFDSHPDEANFSQLQKVVGEIENNPEIFRNSKAIVFDLRGNGGGSSVWSLRIANAIWGEKWVEFHGAKGSDSVDWRASNANLKSLEDFLAQIKDANPDPLTLDWTNKTIKGFRNAISKGEVFYIEKDDSSMKKPQKDLRPKYFGKSFVITDEGCGSACLDAVDTFKALGAKQIGRETSADTLYMDIRQQTLPSNLATITIPMKVYRGRQRGNNEPQKPDILFDNITDDNGLVMKIKKNIGE